MDVDATAPGTQVPGQVSEPEHAAPTPTEPASGGAAAESSGALSSEQQSEAQPSDANAEAPAANGAVEPAPSSGSPPDASAQSASEAPADTTAGAGAKEADASAEAGTEGAAPDTNGTPAAKKGAVHKRKSTGGISEHKFKKLNKKKSVAKMTHLDAKPGDYFFARLKSYPPWPSIICDEDMLPQSLRGTRPVTTKKEDGTYNDAYADGGKKVTERTFPVMFLFTNEFAWIPNTDLSPLNPEECKDVGEKGKSKSLVAAYQVAAENHDLKFFKDMLEDHARAVREDEERKEAREAEKVAKAERKKRKSEAKTEADDVEMEEAEAEVKKSSKKRKKEADSEDEEAEKPPKTPKVTKLKLTTNKTPATAEKKAKEKGAKERKKPRAPTSEEEAAEVAEEEPEKPLTPAEARKAREKEVLFLRHRLQKGFLSRDQAPQEDEMPQMSNYIKKLENYGELEVSIIRNTKINKVLKALIKLNTIPKDEEFEFRKRSVELLAKWNKILGSEPAEPEASTTPAAADKESKPSPTTNGVHENKAEEKKDEAETPAEKTAEPSEAADKVSGEVDTDAGAKAEVAGSLQQDEEEKPTTADSTPTEEASKAEAASDDKALE